MSRRPTHRPVGRPSRCIYAEFTFWQQRERWDMSPALVTERWKAIRRRLLGQYSLEVIRANGLDNPFMAEDARLVLINMATCRGQDVRQGKGE